MNALQHRLRKILVRAWPDVPAALPSDRRRLVSAVESALMKRARRQHLQRWTARVGIASAAALVLVATGWEISDRSAKRQLTGNISASAMPATAPGSRILRVLQLPLGGPKSTAAIVTAGNAPQPVAGGTSLETGIRLVAPERGEVRLGNAQGTTLTVEPSGELTIVSQGDLQRYTLESGAVRARVAKLGAVERFVIATRDSEVEVHGTAFRVSLVAPDPKCSGGVQTRVSVTEGVVSVRSRGVESFVSAGDEWPRDCARPTTASAPSRTEAVQVVASHLGATDTDDRSGVGSPRRRAHQLHRSLSVTRRAESMASTGTSGTSPSRSSSNLASQNDLFAAAVAAKRAGRSRDAVKLFSELIATYSDSPLLESAMVQKIRLMRETDPDRIKDASSEYLGRFPTGFARAEVRRIANIAP